MTFLSRKINKRTRNVSSAADSPAPIMCGMCSPAEPEGTLFYAEKRRLQQQEQQRRRQRQQQQQPCAPIDDPRVVTPTKQQQRKEQHRRYLPKTVSTCTAATLSTAATAMSSRSLYSAASSSSTMSMGKNRLCPVTGVYADINKDYHIFPKIIGKGHYGIVRECVHRATRQTLAVKTIDKSTIGRLDHLQREIYLLASVDHQNIMKIMDCYEDAECVHIITENYTGGELFDKVVEKTSSRGCMSEREAAAIIKSLLDAVAHLHENGIVHRDIKPENILFESKDDDAAIKLIDFGLSRRHEKHEEPMSNPVGTAYYMSPELLKGRYDNSCDIWAVGIVAYILLCGYPPFNGSSDSEIQESTRRGKLQFSGTHWISKSDDAMDFVKCLLRRDPRKRFTAKEALMHPWMRRMTTFEV